MLIGTRDPCAWPAIIRKTDHISFLLERRTEKVPDEIQILMTLEDKRNDSHLRPRGPLEKAPR